MRQGTEGREWDCPGGPLAQGIGRLKGGRMGWAYWVADCFQHASVYKKGEPVGAGRFGWANHDFLWEKLCTNETS